MEPPISSFEVPAAEVNRRFREIRERAREGPVTVTRHGRPVLTLLDFEQFRGMTPEPTTGENLGQLAMIVDNLGDGFVMVDRAWTIRIVNRVAELFLGRSREELVGTPFECVFGAAEEGTEQARRSMDSGEIITRERESEIRAGRTIALTTFPMPRPWDGVGFFFSNITEQTRLRRKLSEVESLVDGLMQCADGRIILMADQDGLIRRWNPFAEDLLGWSSDDLDGRPLEDIVTSGRNDAIALRTARGAFVRGQAKSIPLTSGTLLISKPDQD